MPGTQPSQSIVDRILRFLATFLFTAGSVMLGTGSTRFDRLQPWLLVVTGAILLLVVFARMPLDTMRHRRTGEPLFESRTQRNVIFGVFMFVMFAVLYGVGRLMAATM